MKRREFSQALSAVAVTASAVAFGKPIASDVDQKNDRPGARSKSNFSMGTNLSGMEWANPGLRHSLSSAPNIHFTVPRKADIAYLAANGFKKNRLPIQWELLQPMLFDTDANAPARAAIGQPGAFHAVYESYITGVLDAHAAVGTTCIIDNHNYGRYQDFRYQSDGSVTGLTVPPGGLLRPFTKDRSQIRTRIFALAPGATLTVQHFTDFWIRAAKKWQKHPGFGGYGLMNEPHDFPKQGGIVASDEDDAKGKDDLTIWPAYAQAAIRAIRSVDSDGLIYVGGNQYSSAMSLATQNPGFPLEGDNLIYEVHMYLDAFNNGAAFDYDHEVSKKLSAGFGRGSIHRRTGFDRLEMATKWAKKQKVRLALTEVGMPIDDTRWHDMFKEAARHAYENDCEIYTWMGGNHWPIRNYAMNQVPGWHQNKTLEPLVAGVLKEVVGIDQATLFDDGNGYGAAGDPLTITVYARGSLKDTLKIAVKADGKGTLSKKALTLDAGANGSDSFTYTPAVNEIATISYAASSQGRQLPPPRKVFSMPRPDDYAEKNLADAALAILAKYGASKWDMADVYTDYVLGAPAAPGQTVRAVSDSGYGSSPGNAMEMLNFLNTDSGNMGGAQLPVMRVVKGRKCVDFSRPDVTGLWCKKSAPMPGAQLNPINRMPYNLEDPHFVLAAVSITEGNHSGVIFEASRTEDGYFSTLGFDNNRPSAAWWDKNGKKVELLGDKKVITDDLLVLGMTSRQGAQQLRMGGVQVATATEKLAPSVFTQMLIGWGYPNYYPKKGFGGSVFAVVTGKGVPSNDELAVLEKYLRGSTRSA